MTTEAQTAANRGNAKRSTGPKTASGKARVARNAVRHGATRATDPELVMDWFRTIMGVPNIGIADSHKDDETTRLALRLAGAEVRLATAQVALDEFEANPSFLARNPDVQDIVDDVGDHMAFEAGARTEDEFECYNVKVRLEFLEKFNTLRITAREFRLLKRYLREARSHRNRAFKDWIEHLLQTRDDHVQITTVSA